VVEGVQVILLFQQLEELEELVVVVMEVELVTVHLEQLI